MKHALQSFRLARRSVSQRLLCRRTLALFATWAVLGAGTVAGAAPMALAPQYAGQYAAGNGAYASFVQIDGAWRGSTVLWNEAESTYGSGSAIGSFDWGTGLWGRADWEAVQQANAGVAVDTALRILQSWSGTVETINHANAAYNRTYRQQWGAASLVPFFADQNTLGEQENWTAHFTGYIRVAEAGFYDFSVLNDDGFFLNILGAAGERAKAGRDFLNPRERNGLGDGLELDAGLYGFELGQWNRLETGVVDLRWRHSGSKGWTLVPTAHLMTEAPPAQAVPEPGSAWLAGLALSALLLRRRLSGGSQ